jgi:hypothetical protein
MRTFQEFQEQIQKGRVISPEILSPEQNRAKREAAANKQRKLTHKKLARIGTQGTNRHIKTMKKVVSPYHSHGTQDSEHSSYHYNSPVYEDLTAQEFGTAQQRFQQSSQAKLAAKRQSAQKDPKQRSAQYADIQRSKIEQQKAKSASLSKRSMRSGNTPDEEETENN